jgi:hypothetical protein
MKPQWVKSLTIQSSIKGISINPTTKYIIAHSGGTSPYLVILSIDGNVKGAYTYEDAQNYN